MREFKFRAWSKAIKKMVSWEEILNSGFVKDFFLLKYPMNPPIPVCDLMQFTGLYDLDDKEIYVGDILEFDGGDRIIVRSEDYLEVFCEPIGDPDCEDQWRDLYRIERSTVIGNIYENPEMLK